MLEISANLGQTGPKILIIGVGGGGNNAVARMLDLRTENLDFAAINTDKMVLERSPVPIKLQIGDRLTSGYGAGANPEVGEAAANENEDEIRDLISNYNMIIITCGMGGGTGTGGAPIIAKLAKEAGILVIGVVTTPFQFESAPRLLAAKKGVEKLEENVDMLLIIPNDKLLNISEIPMSLEDGFNMADSVLRNSIEGITNIVYNCGAINIDFNDLTTTLKGKGIGHLGLCSVDAGTPIIEAVKQAINSPLLETTIVGATNILLNTSGKTDMASLNEALTYVRETAGSEVNLIWRTVSPDDKPDTDKIIVTLIATGMPEKDEGKSPISNAKIQPPPLSRNANQIDTPQIHFPESQEIQMPDFLRKNK